MFSKRYTTVREVLEMTPAKGRLSGQFASSRYGLGCRHFWVSMKWPTVSHAKCEYRMQFYMEWRPRGRCVDACTGKEVRSADEFITRPLRALRTVGPARKQQTSFVDTDRRRPFRGRGMIVRVGAMERDMTLAVNTFFLGRHRRCSNFCRPSPVAATVWPSEMNRARVAPGFPTRHALERRDLSAADRASDGAVVPSICSMRLCSCTT